MKKVVLLLIILVMAVTLLFSAFSCAAPAPAPAPAPEVIEWKLSGDMTAKQYPYGVVLDHFEEEITKRTDGRLKINIYLGGELGYDAMDYLRHIRDGSFDMCTLANPWLSEDFPLISIGLTQFLWSNIDEFGKALKEVNPRLMYPLLERDFNCVALWEGPWPEQYIWTKDEPLTSLDAFKGLKVRVDSKAIGTIMSEMRAVPVHLHGSEVYMGLQRGTVDAACTSGTSMYAYKAYEVVNYVTFSRHYFVPNIYLVNKDAFDSLPKDIQDTVREVADEMFGYHLDAAKEYNKLDMDKMYAEGVEGFEMPTDVRAKMVEVAKEYTWETGIIDCEEAGYGDEARELFRAYLDITGQEYPNWL